MHSKTLITAAVCAWFMAGSAHADPRSGEMLGNTCAGCHGTFGASAGLSMPSLAGMNKRYLYQTMLDFKSGRRESTIMGRMARAYSDNELRALAAFFGDQQWQQAPVKVDAKLVARGEALHQAKCASCHKDGGRYNSQEVPRLAGQWPQFLSSQLQDMAREDFHGPQPIKMRQRVRELSREDMQALADYYASLK